jgi:putative DNA primase/helicase
VSAGVGAEAVVAAPDFLKALPRWVLWRQETRKGRPTKVPKTVRNTDAATTRAADWSSFEAVDACKQKNNGLFDGIGVVLGNLGDNWYLIGVDLDASLDEDGALAVWARPFLHATPTYTEISPSGRGLKLSWRCRAEHVRPFLDKIGVQATAWGSKRAIPGFDAADHGPAVEVYCAARYFTVTGNQWPGTPDEVAILDESRLDRLAELVPKGGHRGNGPSPPDIEEVDPNKLSEKLGAALHKRRRLRERWNGSKERLRDTSRSAFDFSLGAMLKAAGFSRSEMRAALIRNEHGAGKEKAEAGDERYFDNIWTKTTAKAAAEPGTVPTISVTGGLRHEHADAGIAAMRVARVQFYQRDRSLVRICAVKAKASDCSVVTVPGIVPVTCPTLARALGQSARWERVNRDGEMLRIDPPREVVEQIAGMLGEWPFETLAGVIGTPTLRPNGSLLQAEGYDLSTGLYLFSPPPMPDIPERPTWHDAEAALSLLNELLVDFPFANNASRSVGMSMLMTPVLRGALAPAVPMHAVTAPESGTGKSYLADLASVIAIGERCAVQSVAPKEEETEKRLIGAALDGHPIIAMDNCNGVLRGDFLCQVTERPVLRVRPLGGSGLVRIPNTFTTFVNGNNLVVAADLTRRTIQCVLDANMEDPSNRTFSGDPVATVLADRGRYIAAILTIARAYLVAGQPDQPRRLASFERWSDLVCGALRWLKWEDPVNTMSVIRADDPTRQYLAAVLGAWPAEQSEYSTTELIEAALECDPSTGPLRPAWLAALNTIARDRQGNLDPVTLGIWLRDHRDRMAGNLKLVRTGTATRPCWGVTG